MNKALITVDRLAETGHEVILSKKNPRIICPDGEVINLRRQQGIFVLDLFVKKSTEGFHGQ